MILYLITVNLFALILTVYDKTAAERQRRRVKESTLMLIAAAGGAPVMYLTMLMIRHKTRKPLFMIGIPLIVLLELAAVVLVRSLWR